METKRIYKVTYFEMDDSPIRETGIFNDYSAAVKSVPLDFAESEKRLDFEDEFYQLEIYELDGNRFRLIKTEVFSQYEDDGEPYEEWEVMNISKNKI